MRALRRLLLAGAFALGTIAPPAIAAAPAPLYQSQMLGCNQQASFSAVAAATRLVQGTATTQIYVCGFIFNAGVAAATAELEYGTGTNCGTGTTALSPNYTLAANGVLPDHSPFFNGMTVPAGNDLCVLPGAALSGTVYYQQF